MVFPRYCRHVPYATTPGEENQCTASDTLRCTTGESSLLEASLSTMAFLGKVLTLLWTSIVIMEIVNARVASAERSGRDLNHLAYAVGNNSHRHIIELGYVRDKRDLSKAGRTHAGRTHAGRTHDGRTHAGRTNHASRTHAGRTSHAGRTHAGRTNDSGHNPRAGHPRR